MRSNAGLVTEFCIFIVASLRVGFYLAGPQTIFPAVWLLTAITDEAKESDRRQTD